LGVPEKAIQKLKICEKKAYFSLNGTGDIAREIAKWLGRYSLYFDRVLVAKAKNLFSLCKKDVD
jgi:hypothetical protein